MATAPTCPPRSPPSTSNPAPDDRRAARRSTDARTPARCRKREWPRASAADRSRRTLPGLPERWSDPPLVVLRALACVPTCSHRPSCSRGSPAGDAAFRPVDRSPGPAAFGSSPPVARRPRPAPTASAGRPASAAGVEARSPVARSVTSRRPPVARHGAAPTASAGRPASAAGVGARSPVARLVAPGAVHADPVSRAIAGRRRTAITGIVGVPRHCRPECSSARDPGCPDARYLGAMWLLAPSEAASTSWTEPVVTIVRPEDRDPVTRFPSPGLRALSGTNESQHQRKTPGQEVFSNPQGYPPKFSTIPRISSIVHRVFTALSPARVTWVTGFEALRPRLERGGGGE